MSEERKNLKSFFSGISTETAREITGLSIINLIAGEELFVNKGIDTILIVIEGRISIFSDSLDSNPLLVISAGSCARQPLPEITARCDSCPSSLTMLVNRKALEIMSSNARCFLYSRVFDSESGRMSGYIENLEKIEARKKLVASALRKKGLEAHRDLSSFEPVMKVLEKIRKLPSSISDLVSQMDSEKTTARNLADLVRMDPSMTAAVLKTINSSYYSLEKKILDITYAIFYLGIDQILQIVVSEGLRSSFSGNPEFQRLYRHSVIISQISGETARLGGKGQSAVAGTIALLHDLGQNVGFILREQNPKISDLIDFLDPSEMGRLLLKSWNMPDFITDTVRYHLYPAFMNPYELSSDIRLSAVNLFVSHLVHDYIHNGSIDECLLAYTDECLDLLGWSGHDIESLSERVLLPEFERKKSLYPEYFREFISRNNNSRQSLTIMNMNCE